MADETTIEAVAASTRRSIADVLSMLQLVDEMFPEEPWHATRETVHRQYKDHEGERG